MHEPIRAHVVRLVRNDAGSQVGKCSTIVNVDAAVHQPALDATLYCRVRRAHDMFSHRGLAQWIARSCTIKKE